MSTEDEECEIRIENEILVDCYNEMERAMGWYYYLEERFAFPFKASCIKEQRGYPLKIGEDVIVISMASENECTSDMKVIVTHNETESIVPLNILRCISRSKSTRVAMRDWHYWIFRGYQF